MIYKPDCLGCLSMRLVHMLAPSKWGGEGGKFASAEAAAPVLQGAPLGVRGDRSGPARHMVPKSGTTIDTHHRQITPRAHRRES